MKIIVVVCSLFYFVNCKVLPDNLSNLRCHRSDPKFEKCLKKSIEIGLPILIKGIPELNVPVLDPFEVPSITVDRTINDESSIKATGKNVKIIGASNVIIENLKSNPLTLVGEIRVNFPFVQVEMDYDAVADLNFSFENKGHFKGNFTNIQLLMRGNLKPTNINGVKYFKIDKLSLKLNVGDAHIKTTAENPELKVENDILTWMINQNIRDVLDIANPIFAEIAAEVLKPVLNRVLATVPAQEILPE